MILGNEHVDSASEMCMCLIGVTMSVILDLSYTVSIWISAAVAITYTLLGGLYSVAYTDIIQLVLIFISLVSYCCCIIWLSNSLERLSQKDQSDFNHST